MATLQDAKTNTDLQGVLTRARKYPVSFGGQRPIQLSYGRLSASIDETPASGNGPVFARLEVVGASCGKVRAFELSRARQEIVCRECSGALAHHRKHYRLVLRIKLRFDYGLGASQ